MAIVRKPFPPDVRADVWDKTSGKCTYCKAQLNPFRDFTIDPRQFRHSARFMIAGITSGMAHNAQESVSWRSAAESRTERYPAKSSPLRPPRARSAYERLGPTIYIIRKTW